jgi:site-specific recombinase XerD
MKFTKQLSDLLQAFFDERMMGEMNASPHTRASYSYTFQLLLQYAKKKLKKPPSQLTLDDINYKFIRDFLDHLVEVRNIKPQSLNIRLAAIRSFFRYIEPHMPEYSALITKVLAIKDKKTNAKLVDYLNDKEVEALLKAPDQQTWLGCRDHCLLAFAIQTGLRLAEIISLRWKDVHWGEHASIHCMGKGRNERDTALNRQTTKILHAWSEHDSSLPSDIIFPTITGNLMSPDAVQYLVNKYTEIAAKNCPSLRDKKITPHVLRHTTAMRLLHKKTGLAAIALFLGHESLKTTYKYLSASVELIEEIMRPINPLKTKTSRFRPSDKTLMFLKNISGSKNGRGHT